MNRADLEYQRCPFEGVYTIESPLESDLSYNPSNIFVCPRQSFITAQCDHPTRLRIHSKCSLAKVLARNLNCLGSWTTNGLVRLLLADDERQRYSAWYRDYAASPAPAPGQQATEADAAPSQDAAGPHLSPVSPTPPQTFGSGEFPWREQQQQQQQQPQQPQQLASRSQHLLASATGSGGSAPPPPPLSSLAPIVDLQLSLITPFPIVTKPMQVRLTRRSQCADLRGYSSQGSINGGNSLQSAVSSYSFSSYTSPATVSSAAIGQGQQHQQQQQLVSMLMLIVTNVLLLLFPLLRGGVSTAAAAAAAAATT